MVAAIVVVVVAAFGGAALAHVLWPNTSSPSNTQLGLTPGGLNLGSGANGLLPFGLVFVQQTALVVCQISFF